VGRLLLALVHPARNRQQQERDRAFSARSSDSLNSKTEHNDHHPSIQ
jgi:hypothetical protein